MPFLTVNTSAVRCCVAFPQGSRPKDNVGKMSLLFARSCFVNIAFWAQTSEVKDDVEEGCFNVRIEAEAEVDTEVKLQGGAVEANSIMSTSSEAASGLWICKPQLLQNSAVGP
jgi:hypothetical protein